jgi:ABC-type dipeptide/oligopeptide/nickel transport system permease subunit
MAGKLKSQRLRDYLRDPSALVGSILMLVFIFSAVFAPLLAPMDPYDLTTVDLGNFLLPPAWMDGSVATFPPGTDDQGRGILSTILFGLRTPLIVGFSVVAICIANWVKYARTPTSFPIRHGPPSTCAWPAGISAPRWNPFSNRCRIAPGFPG